MDWVAGTACFYRRELFDKAGLLDDSFVMYHEDIEFCLRVSDKTDYKVCMFSDKLVTHYMEHHEPLRMKLASLTRAQYYSHKNYVLLTRRHCPEYLPKIFLHNLLDIIYWLKFTICRKRVKRLLASGYVAVVIIVATFVGLFSDPRPKTDIRP